MLSEESHMLLTELHSYMKDCHFLMKRIPVRLTLRLHSNAVRNN